MVPFCRIGETESGEALGESGCSRMVTRGTKVFHVGQVEVSIRAFQTSCVVASMCVALLRWRTASDAEMFGVELVLRDGDVDVDVDVMMICD